MEISVVVPVYGCPKALEELHSRLTKSLSELTSEYEIIFVNDNCPKNSWAEIEKVCAKDKKTIGVELSRNFGQQRAILAGLDISHGNYVVVMDCDLQDRPEDIPALYKKAKEDYDVVWAEGPVRKKKFLSRIYYKVYSALTGNKVDPAKSNFCILNRKVVNAHCSMREFHRSFTEYINWLGFKTTSVEVDRDDRFEGKSSYSLKKRIHLAVEIITSQTTAPIKMLCGFGIIMSILSLLTFLVFAITRIFVPVTPLVLPAILTSIFFVGGIILWAIGLIGIYVGNVFLQTKQRPLYVVRQILNNPEDENN